MSIELTIFEASFANEAIRGEISKLRNDVWQVECPGSSALTTPVDSVDTTARHWIATCGLQIVGTARLSFHDTVAELPNAEVYEGVLDPSLRGPIASLNRLVVDTNYRRLGIARQLDAIRLKAAEDFGCRYAVGSTRGGPTRVKRLVDLGFHDLGVGEPYVEGVWCHGKRPNIILRPFPSSAIRSETTHGS